MCGVFVHHPPFVLWIEGEMQLFYYSILIPHFYKVAILSFVWQGLLQLTWHASPTQLLKSAYEYRKHATNIYFLFGFCGFFFSFRIGVSHLSCYSITCSSDFSQNQNRTNMSGHDFFSIPSNISIWLTQLIWFVVELATVFFLVFSGVVCLFTRFFLNLYVTVFCLPNGDSDWFRIRAFEKQTMLGLFSSIGLAAEIVFFALLLPAVDFACLTLEIGFHSNILCIHLGVFTFSPLLWFFIYRFGTYGRRDVSQFACINDCDRLRTLDENSVVWKIYHIEKSALFWVEIVF